MFRLIMEFGDDFPTFQVPVSSPEHAVRVLERAIAKSPSTATIYRKIADDIRKGKKRGVLSAADYSEAGDPTNLPEINWKLLQPSGARRRHR